MGCSVLNLSPTPSWVILLLLILSFFFLGLFIDGAARIGDYANIFVVLGVIGTWVAIFVSASVAIKNARANNQLSIEQAQSNHRLSIEHARKQHTINFLYSTKHNNTIYERHLRNFRKKYPDQNTVITFEEHEKLIESNNRVDQNAYYAIIYLLNYYEFLGVGVSTGDLDEDLLQKTVRGQLLRLTNQLRKIIDGYREKDTNHYGKKTLEHYHTLAENWKKPEHDRTTS